MGLENYMKGLRIWNPILFIDAQAIGDRSITFVTYKLIFVYFC
ncbi:hypothetical protein NMY3_01500 [Candidatus Nitrosocosmicus oleophilus]|uniref:Uncharacterized protein n=1 Tax=Candidatus Nitrosocosmicus oleophilus TaxID=1353260 RepID=A0A654LZE6_9ARCH|nr:hypothetical protein NMY3_01500 [Candidatus Nitrosocosmicus oleophilus]